MCRTTMAVALAALMTAVGNVGAQKKLDDGQIVALFDEANTTDIWTARLAMSRSQSSDVRKLAAMVIADHETVQYTARELAKKWGVAATPPADDASADALAVAVKELQSKGSDEFDRAYLAHELAFHRSAIDAVTNTLLPAAANPELRTFLKNALGGFEHHLAETRRIAGTLGVR